MIYLIILLLAFLGLSLRYNWWRKSVSFAHARVLMYHSIDEHFGERFDKWRVKPSEFEKQIAYLSKHGFKSYKLSEMLNLDKIPPKSVVISFDDGFANNFKAFEILQKYGFKASIFLVPNAKQNTWDSQNTEHLSDMLSAEQIKIMQESGLVEFGAHTMTHANLCKCDDPKSEIANSKIEVEKLSGKKCEIFAYPYGKYDENILNFVRELGFIGAVVVKRGVYKMGDDKFSIKRIGILGTESMIDFWLRITKIRNKL